MTLIKYCCLFLLIIASSDKILKPVHNNEVNTDCSKWRGVNLPLQINWATKNSLSQADFDYASSAGANVIRLSVHSDPEAKNHSDFLDDNGKLFPLDHNPGLDDLDKAVKMAEKDHLKVIIDMHTMPGTTGAKIWEEEKYWDYLTQIWVLISQKFKNNKTIVAFDLMNEPGIIGYIRNQNIVQKTSTEAMIYLGKWTPPDDWKNTPRDYNMHMTKIIREIRIVDSSRCAIVEGFGILGNPINFNWMMPIQGFNNIVYSFHMYVPTGITMLGTAGSIKKGQDENVKPFDPAIDESNIDDALAPVIAFQKKYNVPIYVGEFGITNKAIFGKDANGDSYNGACWLTTIIKKMDKNKWGWTYWDFWTAVRKPESNNDPRYVILSAAMKREPLPRYCK